MGAAAACVATTAVMAAASGCSASGADTGLATTDDTGGIAGSAALGAVSSGAGLDPDRRHRDAGKPDHDASAPIPPPPAADAGSGGGRADGPPTRRQCTSGFGSGLTTAHGRLDGTIVSVIAPGQGRSCNGDSSHVHLQVLVGSDVYDVAVNTGGEMTTTDHALVGGAWAEGWHAQDALDYATSLDVHASAFSATRAASVEADLAQANHVSLFCTGYGPTGCHLVHRQSGGHDGAIVTDPLSPTAHWLLFDFADDQF